MSAPTTSGRPVGTLAGLLALLALAGCGGGKENRVPDPATEQGAPRAFEDASAAPTTLPFRTAAQCGNCHEAIYEEWRASMHGRAMSDPLFLKPRVENKEECIRCHAPVPLREVDFDTPIARLDRREDAVSCLTCHQAGGNVTGPLEGLSGACRPIADRDQTNVVRMCFGCHNQHDTGTEWLSGPYGPHAVQPRVRPEANCLDCHMPAVERPLVAGGPIRKGRRHTWPGGHDFPMIRRAAEVDVEVEPLDLTGGFRFRVFVENVGAGHMIPTDARHRSFDTYVKLWDTEGNVILDPVDFGQQARAHAATYRKFYRNSGLRDTQVPPLTRLSGIEVERGYVDVPTATAGRGEVWLVYRLTPDDALMEKSRTDPGTFDLYRARVVKRREFTYGP